mmetsp:Transcript_7737/g.22028  ORF Transcript_7737/g.22028 Transcript_7737/m.22028 type:complete len:150 (-) Transcript_7737:746-1195(-)
MSKPASSPNAQSGNTTHRCLTKQIARALSLPYLRCGSVEEPLADILLCSWVHVRKVYTRAAVHHCRRSPGAWIAFTYRRGTALWWGSRQRSCSNRLMYRLQREAAIQRIHAALERFQAIVARTPHSPALLVAVRGIFKDDIKASCYEEF